MTRTRCCNARERNNRTRATPERERRRFSRAVTKPTPASSHVWMTLAPKNPETSQNVFGGAARRVASHSSRARRSPHDMAASLRALPLAVAAARRVDRRPAAPRAALVARGGRATGVPSFAAKPSRTVATRARGPARFRALRASSGDEDETYAPSNGVSDVSSLLTSVADARWFNTYLHLGVFVFILGFIDAGYSRDWTRIGAITPESEQKLRDLAVVLGQVHIVAAAAAGVVASKRNLPVPAAVAKTLLIGFLAFCEVCFKSAGGDAET